MRLAWIIALGLLFACGDDATPPPEGQTTCTRDSELIAARSACVTDEHCPCGAHCTLGECVADCESDGECGSEQRCDTFGYCRAASDTSRIPAFPPEEEGELVITQNRLEIFDETQDQRVRVSAVGRDLGVVRALADEGLQVSCDGSAFNTECRLDNLVAGGAANLLLRVTEPLVNDEVRLLRVFAGTQRQLISVTVPASVNATGLVTGEATRAVGGPLSGRYRGEARLISAAVDGAEATRFENPESFGLSAELFAAADTGSAVLSLRDDGGVLAGVQDWVGALEVLADGGGTVDFPAVRVHEGSAAFGAAVEIVLDAPEASIRVDSVGARSISFALQTRQLGALGGGRAVQTNWNINLFRVGDLDGASEPPVPADAVAMLDPERGDTLTPWEARFGEGLRTLVDMPDRFFGRADDVFPTYSAEGANVIACAVPSDEQLFPAAWIQAFADGETNVRADGSSEVAVVDRQLAAYLSADETSPLFQLLYGPIAEILLEDPDPLFFDLVPEVAVRSPNFGSALPCAFSSASVLITRDDRGRIQSAYDYALGPAVDGCEAMAETYECEITESPADDTATLSIFGESLMDNGISNNIYDGTITLDVQRRCVFPETRHLVARDCGELVACFDPRSSARGESARLGSETIRSTGDLRCGDGTSALGAMLPADVNAGDLSNPAMLNACIENLARLQDDPSPLALGELFEDAACVDAARLFTATNLAFEHMRVRAQNPAVQPRAREQAFAQRMLQRWVQLHTFIARQSGQAERLAQVIRRVAPDDAALPPPLDDALAASLGGWDLLLHPRIADGLFALPGEVLARTDYRALAAPAFIDEIESGRDQGEGIAVAILDGLASQLSLLQIRLERAQNTADRSALILAGDVLRHVHRMRPLAEELAARANAWAASEGEAVPWQQRYEIAQGQLDALLASTATDMQALREGRNPFGIEDADLPLYFLADTVGAGGRFSAISDFLLGPSPGSSANFAPRAIEQASEAFAGAREAWLRFTDRQTAREYAAAELEERLEEIRLRFGGEVQGYCGAPSALNTVNTLEDWEREHGEPFSPDTCFYNRDNPDCAFDFDAWASLFSAEDLVFQYCVADELSRRLGDAGALATPSARAVLADFDACAADAEFPAACNGGGTTCFVCNGDSVNFEPSPAELNALAAGAPDAILNAARNQCATRFPSAATQLPGTEQADSLGLGNPACYRGSLGEATLTARAIAQDVAIARSELAEFQERYDIVMQSCIILQNGNDEIQTARDAHNETMSALRAGKLAADIAANVAGGAKDCAATVAGSDVSGKAAIGAACGAAAVEAAADSVSDGLQFAMDEAQQKHDAAVAAIEERIAEQQCINDASLELVGARTAALRVQRAFADLQIALFQLAELKVQVGGSFSDGLGLLEAARDRAVAPMAHDYWMDEALETFVRRMRTARRLAYLTVRAVEYEYQQSLGDARANVLAAEVPDELEQALDELWSTAGSRRIRGAAPTDLKVVLSLKRNLLQLGDNSMQGAGAPALSDTDRLRRLLLDPRYEVYEDGNFVGRAIPFNLVPLETLGLGETQGIAVFSRNSCAERLWSVNATVLGNEERLFIGDDPSFIDIQLLKANTFYSQWCSDGNDTPFQEASVRPSRNLFADPASATSIGDETGLGNETELFSRARMQAFFNVDRDDFSADDFANGDSSELAARGLYGRYAIFFPAGVLSESGGTGLDLNAVDDILLRLDYVSVAR